jgi:molecular chaperone GrpE
MNETKETAKSTQASDISSSAESENAGADNASEDSLLGKMQSDLERFRDLALRSQADFDNFRKRAAREKDEAIKFANANLIEKLLPIIDNFELGLIAARQNAQGTPILQGMELVYKQLQDFLSQHGVEEVVAEGATFDPNLHEAVAQEESATIPEGHVVRQLRKGYKLRDRLLRAALVVVSK